MKRFRLVACPYCKMDGDQHFYEDQKWTVADCTVCGKLFAFAIKVEYCTLTPFDELEDI